MEVRVQGPYKEVEEGIQSGVVETLQLLVDEGELPDLRYSEYPLHVGLELEELTHVHKEHSQEFQFLLQ